MRMSSSFLFSFQAAEADTGIPVAQVPFSTRPAIKTVRCITHRMFFADIIRQTIMLEYRYSANQRANEQHNSEQHRTNSTSLPLFLYRYPMKKQDPTCANVTNPICPPASKKKISPGSRAHKVKHEESAPESTIGTFKPLFLTSRPAAQPNITPPNHQSGKVISQRPTIAAL
ncbi:hypothetical protein B9Z19DRAFT_1077123 [Tuber borchii]|uniref:Uncharacterized protein n=1 Tax=Tuber borchii TaxID=42251 RepID=A0A2T7A1B0_TUBBO|nr:hypothetical protein B9Z19DRAFT_1077123 [Tuber borchii]